MLTLNNRLRLCEISSVQQYKNSITFKAHHRILRQIICKITKFQTYPIKNKDAMFKTTQYSARRQPGPIY